MALDPSIVLQAGRGVTPLKDPSEIADEQATRQLRQLQVQSAQQGVQDDQAYRQALQSGASGDALVSALQQRGLGKQAMDYQKFQGEQQKTAFERGKAVTDAMKVGAEAVMQNPTEQFALQTLDDISKRYGIPPQHFDAGKAAIMQARGDPGKIRQLMGGLGAKADEALGKIENQNLGGVNSIQRTNPYTGETQVLGTQARTQSPDSVASVGQSAANAAMVDARSREANSQRAQATAQGRIPSGYRPSADGQSLEAIPGGPADQSANGNASVDYKKHALALQNMNDALDNYKAKLSNFGTLDMLNPSARAEMGTAYNNAMLQAKEMYALGVLNGGDERILKSILNSPLDWNSAIIPKDALKKQADDLQGILTRNNEALARVNKQPVQPLQGAPSAPKGPQPKQKSINIGGQDMMAELAPDGKYYVQRNGKWNEVR